jgi:putative ABC transport system substrate-binding protein
MTASWLVLTVLLVIGFLEPLYGEAQQSARVYRVGLLSVGGPEPELRFWAPLRELLRERGWTEGQNLVFERRYAEGNYERLPDLAADLMCS